MVRRVLTKREGLFSLPLTPALSRREKEAISLTATLFRREREEGAVFREVARRAVDYEFYVYEFYVYEFYAYEFYVSAGSS